MVIVLPDAPDVTTYDVGGYGITFLNCKKSC